MASSLDTDPAYVAYRSALGYSDGDDVATTQRSEARAGARLSDVTLPGIARQGAREQGALQASYGGEGLYDSPGQHSGLQQAALGRQAEDQTARTGEAGASYDDYVSGLEDELVRRRADRARQLGAAGLDAANRLFTNQYAAQQGV